MRGLRRLFVGISALLLPVMPGASLGADAYPDRPIRAIVPFPPGQGADILMRFLAERLNSQLGQQIVVDNRPGAGGMIGTALASRATPDGYTLYMGSSGPLGISPSIYKNPGYDPVRDFFPISNVASVAQVLVTSSSSTFQSAGELLAAARKRPGEIQYASPGNGTTSHLTMELLALTSRTKLSHVPYKGSPAAHLDVIAGRVPVMFDSTPGVLGHIKSGKLRALGVSTAERIRFLPDTPTVREAGVQGFATMGWIGLLAPAGTPSSIINRLHSSVLKIIQSPEARQRLDELAFAPIGDTPSQFAAFIKSEVALWAKVVKASGATVD
ncbi:MAG: tripartite tricarboxylate transporter substrate binding protein [Burkholderiales bacterium]|nr:tripartite tricarboxylate transporter substrate binding protein [Burkholderiales bacterium]